MIVVTGLVVARGQVRFGHGHAHAHRKALAQRAGGHFDAGREAVLGMPGRLAAPLPEVLDLVQREIVTGEMQQRIQQHGAVPARQDEAIAIGPAGIARVVAQELGPQHVGHRRGAHRQTGMAGVGFLHAVDGQEANGIDAELIEVGVGDMKFTCVGA